MAGRLCIFLLVALVLAVGVPSGFGEAPPEGPVQSGEATTAIEPPVSVEPIEPIGPVRAEAESPVEVAPPAELNPLAEAEPPVKVEPSLSVEPPVKAEPVEMISYKDGLVGANITNEAVGAVISQIGSKAGFKTDINKDVYNKKITTSFKGLDVMSAIRRVLDLAGDNNYFVFYDSKGNVSSVKINKETRAGAGTIQKPSSRPTERQTTRSGFSPPKKASRRTPSRPSQPPDQQLPPELYEEPLDEDQGFQSEPDDADNWN